jgi:mannose-6-phosphate isomerase-like protein (cupin superfamily)
MKRFFSIMLFCAAALFPRALSAFPMSSPDGGGPLPTDTDEVIGGIGLTHLTVYDQRPAPDGLNSGCPHVHAVTDEGYYVMSGSGRVEIHDVRFGFRSVELLPGRYLQFPPGTLHRLVSVDRLTILVVMGNAGLAERGDARIYFGKRIDDDPAEFARLVGLAKAGGIEGALKRRDAAVRAYRELMKFWKSDRPAYDAELKRFIDLHLATAAGQREAFLDAVRSGPLAWVERARARLAALPLKSAGDISPLLHLPPVEPLLGMCGLLRPVTSLEPVFPEKEPDARR